MFLTSVQEYILWSAQKRKLRCADSTKGSSFPKSGRCHDDVDLWFLVIFGEDVDISNNACVVLAGENMFNQTFW